MVYDTTTSSYSFNYKFSFKIVPHIAILCTKSKNLLKKNHFLKKNKIMPQTRPEPLTSLQCELKNWLVELLETVSNENDNLHGFSQNYKTVSL